MGILYSGFHTHTSHSNDHTHYIVTQGWKLALARQPVAGKFYVGPVEFLSGLVKCPITSIQIKGFVSCQAPPGLVDIMLASMPGTDHNKRWAPTLTKTYVTNLP